MTQKTTKTKASGTRSGLSRHYNASQLRIDTWDRLKSAANRLEERQNTTQNLTRLQQSIEQFFDILEPIESYWAFPGSQVLAELKSYFERQQYALLANGVANIVQLLVSEAYRSNLMPLQVSVEDRLSGASYGLDETHHNPAEHHYFEVLFVDTLSAPEEKELRRRMLRNFDAHESFVYDIVVVPSFEDALMAVLFNHNIQSCVIPYQMAFKSKNGAELLERYIVQFEESELQELDVPHLGIELGQLIKRLRPELDLFLTINSGVEEIAAQVYQDFRRVFYRQENYLELHLSIRQGIMERYQTPFFTALKEYSQRPTGVFHAMPISRGNSVFKSHWIRDMGDFYGRNILLAETSATTGGLDSLLQPTGPLKTAQEKAAQAFRAQHTFFVTNGTSTANKIVMQALVQPGDIVLIDRDCHKSHHYGLVLAGAYPVYLDSYPIEEYSMYGAVPLREIKEQLLELKRLGQLDRVKMLLLTNCTFDGLVYNVERVMEEVLALKPDMIFLWDEAWFAFAAFSPTYRQRTGMETAGRLQQRFQSENYRKEYATFQQTFAEQETSATDPHSLWLDTHLLPDPDQAKIRVYTTQSTHKKLTSLRQGSMIHVYDEEFQRKVEDSFHEAYMTHTSTSPNYQILASLDIARRQVQLEGYELVQKSVELAMTLRAKVAEHPLLCRYFDVLTPQDLLPERYRLSQIERYYDPESGWGRLEEAWRTDEFVLDPTHINLYVGKTGIDGDTFKNQYLMDQFGIQINKTSRNTVLFMTNIGTTRSSIAFLISVLLKIAKQLERMEKAYNAAEAELHKERVRSLTEDVPPLPDFSAFHPRFRPDSDSRAGDMRAAYFLAYNEELCEYLQLDGSIEEAMNTGRQIVSTSFVIPYPPGFPVLVPGQIVSREILAFLKALDVKEIHGYRPNLGLRVFREAVLGDLPIEATAERATTNTKRKAKNNTKSGAKDKTITKDELVAETIDP